MNLIIVERIFFPPTEGLYLRYLTMLAKENLQLNVLIEARKERIDKIYKNFKIRGLMDFVDDLIVPEYQIEGIRLDKELNYPKTILVKSITCENIINVIGQIKFIRESIPK